MFRRCAWAWMVSASAAARKSLAICAYPSFSAAWAKARYLRLAWLSPAKATARFSWVVGMQRPLPFPAEAAHDRRHSVPNGSLGAEEAPREVLPLPVGEERVRGADELAAVRCRQAQLILVEPREPLPLRAQPAAGPLSGRQGLPLRTGGLDGEEPAAAVVLALGQRGLPQDLLVHRHDAPRGRRRHLHLAVAARERRHRLPFLHQPAGPGKRHRHGPGQDALRQVVEPDLEGATLRLHP